MKLHFVCALPLLACLILTIMDQAWGGAEPDLERGIAEDRSFHAGEE